MYLLVNLFNFNTLSPGCFWGFLEKKHLNAHGFAQEYLRSSLGTDVIVKGTWHAD